VVSGSAPVANELQLRPNPLAFGSTLVQSLTGTIIGQRPNSILL